MQTLRASASAVPFRGWVPAFGRPKERSTATRLEQRKTRTAASSATASGLASTAVTVAGLAPPWSLIGAAVLGAVAGGLAIANKVRNRGDLALSGDQKAIAGFMRRSARWGAEKRERKAKSLTSHLQKVRGRIKKRGGKRRAPNRLLVEEAQTRMKLGALVALEVEARKAPRQPLVASDPATTPAIADVDPAANQDRPDDDVPASSWLSMDNKLGPVPVPVALGGGVFFGLILLAWAFSRGGAERRMTRRAA